MLRKMMLAAESKKGKRFILQLREGTDLIQEISRFCSRNQIRSATLSASGLLKQVTWQPGALGQTTVLRAPLQLISGSGYVFFDKNQIQTMCYAFVGGKSEMGTLQFGMGPIRQALVLSLQVTLESFEDLTIVGNIDTQTQLLRMTQFLTEEQNLLSSSPSENQTETQPEKIQEKPLNKKADLQVETKASVSFEKGGGSAPISWKTVQAASARPIEPVEQNRQPAIEETSISPKAGDILQHETFGRCEVASIDEERDRLVVRARSGRLLELSLDYLHLQSMGTEGNAQVFKMIRHKSERIGPISR